MRILVTGSDGLLGTSLLPALSGHETTGLTERDGDVADPRFVRAALTEHRPELVVHLAAFTHVDRCETEAAEAFRVNAEGARVVAAEAERAGAAVLALSTDYVFDGTARQPYGEDASPRPLGVYGRSKQAGEEAVKGACTRWTVVRTAWLYGPGGRNFVDAILDLLATGDEVPVVEDQVGSPTLSVDLARGLCALIEARARGLIHLVNAGQASWYTLAREAARLTGRDVGCIRPITTRELGRPAPRPAYSVLDAGRARERFGVGLRPWPEALADYLTEQAAHPRPGRTS